MAMGFREMRRAAWMLLLLLPGVPVSAQPEAGSLVPAGMALWAIGDARDSDSGELLYREFHYRSAADSPLPELVHYVGADGELLVRKTLDTRVSARAPGFVQSDLRQGRRLEVQHEASGEIGIAYRSDAESETRRETLSLSPELVIDAGFDMHIRENWQQLLAGRRVSADFMLPTRFDTVRIRVERAGNEECGGGAEPGALCLLVQPAGLLGVVSWFVEPLRLQYDIDSRRLLFFAGPGNLPMAGEAAPEVRISYQYPNSRHAGAEDRS